MSNEQASYRIEVDTERINKLLTALNDNEARKAIRAAIRKSALIIRKQAQENLTTAVPATKTPGVRKGVACKPLKNEIRIAVYKNASGAHISLLDGRKKDSRAFILRFFEAGTERRDAEITIKDTKKKVNRGSIKATYFFKNAVDSKKGEAEKSLEQNIIDSINKVASRKQ